MKPLPCQCSGCIKIAHQACQNNWAANNSVTLFQVAYTLCWEHNQQYCLFIEELNEDNSADGMKEDSKQEAFAKGNNDEMRCDVDDDDNDNFFDVQEEEVEDNGGSNANNGSDVEIDSTSSGGESMNNANNAVRQATAVD